MSDQHEQLRFIQRVLESEATAYDREIAAEMVRKMRRAAQPPAQAEPSVWQVIGDYVERGMAEADAAGERFELTAEIWQVEGAFWVDNMRIISIGGLPAQPEPSPDTEQPERTGVGQWCAPGPADKQRRAWLLRFEDFDRGDAVFYDEQGARETFAKAEARGWNCHLFAHAPRSGDTEQQRRDAVDTLRKFAEGRVAHHNNGMCPDVMEGYGQRDLDCAVCQALAAIEAEGKARE